MNIGEAARRSGLSARTIRYYASIDLVALAARTASGYRDYDVEDVRLLRLLKKAGALGFTLAQRRVLLRLYQDCDRVSADVHAAALTNLEAIAEKISGLQVMRAALEELLSRCPGNQRPECPILDYLTDVEGSKAAR